MSSKWVKKWNVPGSNNNTWVVSQDADGNYGCSCPDWKFRRHKECKHIDLVKTGGASETASLEAVPGNVGEVTINEQPDGAKMVLYPLVPLGVAETTDLAATNIYDMIRAGVSIEKINTYKAQFFPKESFAKIKDHVLSQGRCVYSQWIKGRGWVKPVYVDALAPIKVERRELTAC